MKNKKQYESSLVSVVIFFLIFLMMGIGLGLSIVQAFGDDLQWWQLILRLLEGGLIIFLSFFVQIVLHETGHMLAGLMRGWSFVSFMILGLVLTRKDGCFHWSRFVIPGVGGQCLMCPPEREVSDFDIAFYNAGGVLMNLFTTLLALALLTIGLHAFIWETGVLLGSIGFVGLFFAAVNGFPLCQGGIPNDGMNICNLRKDAFSTNVFLTTMRAMGKLRQGYQLEEVVDNYLAEGNKIDYANPIHVMAVSFDLSLAIVKLDFEKAHAIVDRMKFEEYKVVPIYQREMLYEKVFLYLVSPQDGVDVKNLIDPESLKYFEMQTAFRPTALRVKYAFARLCEHDEAKSERIYEQFYEVCKKYHVLGEVKSEIKLVEYVKGLKSIEA